MLRKNNEKGAVVIEATLALTTFMFAITILLSLVNVCVAQAKIGVAINGITKDISQYTYIYSMTGMNQKQSAWAEDGAKAEKQIGEAVEQMETVTDVISKTIEFGGAVAQDSDLRASLLSYIKDTAAEGAKSLVAHTIIQQFAKQRLVDERDNSEAYLAHLGVVPKGGSYLSGIDFKDSVICVKGSDEIIVVAKYQVQVLDLLGLDIKWNFTQSAATKAWFVGETETGGGGSDPEEDAGGTDKSDGTEEPAGAEEPEGSDKPDATDDPDATGEIGGAEEPEGTNKPDVTEEPIASKSPKTYEEYAKESTHNNSSDQVLLGKFSPTNHEESYVAQAERYGMTYFDMGDDGWNEALADVGEDNMWNINLAFLEQQYAQGKTFYLTKDPEAATGYYTKEVEWLKEKGYSFEYNDAIGLWVAVKR